MKYFAIDTNILSNLMRLEKKLVAYSKQTGISICSAEIEKVFKENLDDENQLLSDYYSFYKNILNKEIKLVLLPTVLGEIIGKEYGDIWHTPDNNRLVKFIKRHSCKVVEFTIEEQNLVDELAQSYVTKKYIESENPSKSKMIFVSPFSYNKNDNLTKFKDPLVMAESAIAGYPIISADGHFSNKRLIGIWNNAFMEKYPETYSVVSKSEVVPFDKNLIIEDKNRTC